MEFAFIRHSWRLCNRFDEYLEIKDDKFDSLSVCNIICLETVDKKNFVMLNRFRPLSKPSHSSPVLNGQYQAGWNNNQNLMKNT